MKKRRLAVLLCCVLTAVALAGCGNPQAAGADTVEDSRTVEGEENPGNSETSEGENPEGSGDQAEQPGNGGSEETESSQEEVQEVEITMKDVAPMDLVKEMKIGWNLGNTLDATSKSIGVNVEMAWGNPRTTQEMIDAIAPKLLPVLFTGLIFYLIKVKKWTTYKLVILTIILGVVLSVLNLIA